MLAARALRAGVGASSSSSRAARGVAACPLNGLGRSARVSHPAPARGLTVVASTGIPLGKKPDASYEPPSLENFGTANIKACNRRGRGNLVVGLFLPKGEG